MIILSFPLEGEQDNTKKNNYESQQRCIEKYSEWEKKKTDTKMITMLGCVYEQDTKYNFNGECYNWEKDL